MRIELAPLTLNHPQGSNGMLGCTKTTEHILMLRSDPFIGENFRMHVLIVPSWYPRNHADVSGSFFREQAIALAKHGCRVGVIYPELRSIRNWRSLFSTPSGVYVEKDEGVHTYRSRGMNWFPRTVGPRSKLFAYHGDLLFERYVKENGIPDIVHVQSLLYGGIIADKIYKRYGVPFVVTEHSSAFARKLVSRKELNLAKEVAINASRCFAVSQPFAKLLDKILNLKGGRWEEMPNIVRDEFIKFPISRNDRKYFEFINIALMVKGKRQDILISAFSEVCKSNPNVKLTLGGDGKERSLLEELARVLGVAEKVTFTGLMSREQVLLAMSAADAFVLSSSYETFGVVVVEALALGKPVIATRCGGPESILHEGDGILVPVDDVNGLADAMRQLMINFRDYDSERIRSACSDRFSETAIASRLKQVYKEIVYQA